jgi:hypothetical protein
MFRRLLKYRNEPDPANPQQNTNFPTTRIPISATKNYPLGDSTNTKNRGVTGVRVAVNTYKINNSTLIDDMNESGFESHCDG